MAVRGDLVSDQWTARGAAVEKGLRRLANLVKTRRGGDLQRCNYALRRRTCASVT